MKRGKVITCAELPHSEKELSALFRRVSNTLARSEAGSPERRACLASLENIGRRRAALYAGLK